MKLFNFYFLLAFISFFGLTACSPHTSTGVWVSSGDNELGISKIIVAFEGRAEFTTVKPVKANWHCFWGKANDQALNLDCTPSTDTKKARKFVITSKDDKTAEFLENNKLIATLIRVNENPVLATK